MEFKFNKANYILLLLGLLLIGIGLILMAGPEPGNPNDFNYDMFSARRITWGTILIIAGYIVELFAIMYIKKA